MNKLNKFINFLLVFVLVVVVGFGPTLAMAGSVLSVADIRIELKDSKAYISWKTNKPASCLIKFDEDSALRYSLAIGGVAKSEHEVILVNLKPQTNYYFIAVCSDNNGGQTESFIQNFKTGKYTNTDQVGDLELVDRRMLEIFPTHVVFYWVANKVGYSKIEYKLKGSTRVVTVNSKRPGPRGAHQVVVSGLTPSTEYYYRIVFSDTEGNTVSSGWWSFKTPANTFGYQPFEITNIRPVDSGDINVFTTEAVVTWRTNRLTAGTIWYNTAGERRKYSVAEYFPYSFGDHRLKLTNLAPDTQYQFHIQSNDVFGKSFTSRVYEFRTKPPQVKASFVEVDVSQNPSYTRPMFLYKVNETGEIYAAFKQGVYKILSPDVLVLNNYLGLETKMISKQEVNRIDRVRLLKSATLNTVYYLYVDQGLIKQINNPSVFTSYSNNKWEDIITVSQAGVENYRVAKLIKIQNDSSVFLIEDNKKRPISSVAVFEKYGFRWSDIVIINKVDLDSYPTGLVLK